MQYRFFIKSIPCLIYCDLINIGRYHLSWMKKVHIKYFIVVLKDNIANETQPLQKEQKAPL